jgi:type IV secretion system protein VirB5
LSNQLKSPELPWTPEEAVLIDQVGNEVYASHYAERKMARFIIATLAVLLACSVFGNISLAKRKLVYRYVRIDEMGRATAIQYNDLNYSPREGEIRTYLTDWTNYRYTINRETIAKKYPLNYYFLSQPLSSQLMGEDNQNHLVSQVLGGQVEQSDVEVKAVTITSMSEETVSGAKFARGTALVNIDKLYSPRYSRQPRTEHWVLSVTYYLNPAVVSDAAKIFPQFETINPLGLVITEFHENRVSVGPFGGGANGAMAAAVDQTGGVGR